MFLATVLLCGLQVTPTRPDGCSFYVHKTPIETEQQCEEELRKGKEFLEDKGIVVGGQCFIFTPEA